MNIDEIKKMVLEKLEIAKTWVLDNKLKASAIALGLVMALFLPSLLWKLLTLAMVAYLIGVVIDKYKN
jgi:hypothetical protein